jgi:hypothetical protein
MITSKIFLEYYALIRKFHIVKLGFKYFFKNVSNFESPFFWYCNIDSNIFYPKKNRWVFGDAL